MNTTDNQNQQNTSMSDKNTDVSRSQNRESASPGNTSENRMGAESNDTGSRPSNSDKDNQRQNVDMDATGSHIEGQYPQNAVNPEEGEGQVGKPGDKPE